jgi:hypothetical protein
MKDRDDIDVHAQVRFGDDGEMEPDEQVSTDLADWDIAEAPDHRETRIEKAAASQFGVDDRPESGEVEVGEQEKLVVERDKDQMDLSGNVGGMDSKFG